MPLPYLLLDHISVNYDTAGRTHTAVRDLSLSLARGEIGCLLGPSGCGKTTVLRAVCGFEPLAGGRIVLDGHEVANAQTSAPPERRHVGVVFQDYALFPHLSVAQNIGFGLTRLPRAEPVQDRLRAGADIAGWSGIEGGAVFEEDLSRALFDEALQRFERRSDRLGSGRDPGFQCEDMGAAVAGRRSGTD